MNKGIRRERRTFRPFLVETFSGQNLRIDSHIGSGGGGGSCIDNEFLCATIVPGISAEGFPDADEGAIGGNIDAERGEDIFRGTDIEQVGFGLGGGGQVVEEEGRGAGEGRGENAVIVLGRCERRQGGMGAGREKVRVGKEIGRGDGDGEGGGR